VKQLFSSIGSRTAPAAVEFVSEILNESTTVCVETDLYILRSWDSHRNLYSV